jgi:hypothetical protein
MAILGKRDRGRALLISSLTVLPVTVAIERVGVANLQQLAVLLDVPPRISVERNALHIKRLHDYAALLINDLPLWELVITGLSVDCPGF